MPGGAVEVELGETVVLTGDVTSVAAIEARGPEGRSDGPDRTLLPGEDRPRGRDPAARHERGHRGRPRRAGPARRHRRRRRGRSPGAAPRRARPAHLHRQGQGRGAARPRPGDRLRHRRVRQRAHPGPAAQPGEAARAHRDRPHRGDPRHLRPERPQPGGQGPGRAGPPPVPPPPDPGQGHRPLAAGRRRHVGRRGAHRHPRPGRDPARGRPPPDPAPHPQARGRPPRDRQAPGHPAQGAAPGRTQQVAIVGYTNAGKSTLLNRLTDAGVLVEDRLFATLDATTRRLDLPGGEKVLLTDTVGFIRKLPHQLVEAFKSTLSVAADADLLVHVVDASALDPEGNIDAVRSVLREIGADEVPVLYAFNKADLAPERGPPAGQGARGLGGVQRHHRRGRRRPAPHDRRPAARPHQRRASWPSPTTAATSSPPSTARARCWPSTPATTACAAGAHRRRVAGPVHRVRDGPLTWRSPSSRRRTPTTGSTSSRPSPPPTPAGSSTSRSARRATRRPTPWSRPWPAPGPSGATRRRSARPAYREAAAGWMARRLGVEVAPAELAACVGTKELVAGLPQWLRLRRPDRDTVLYPAISYPSYAMGATLAGCRAVPYLHLEDIDRRRRRAARCACGSTCPATPPATWATWAPPPRGGGPEASRCCPTSATSSSPGTARPARSSSTAPTASSPCTPSRSARTWPGSGPASTPAIPTSCTTWPRCASTPGSWCPARCRRRPSRRGTTTPTSTPSASGTSAGCELMRDALGAIGVKAPMPGGAFYLWAPAPDGDAWALAAPPGRGRRRAHVARRVLRPRGRRPRAGRRRAARRPPRARRRPPGPRLQGPTPRWATSRASWPWRDSASATWPSRSVWEAAMAATAPATVSSFGLSHRQRGRPGRRLLLVGRPASALLGAALGA